MKTSRLSKTYRANGYLLTEALVYIGASLVLLGVGMVAMIRCMDNSVLLRRNAHDIARAVHIGEVWRADVRKAIHPVEARENEGYTVLQIQTTTNRIEYRFADGIVERRVEPGPWGRVLDRVKSSSMRAESREGVKACCWDLELEPTKRGAAQASRVRPLFSFLAVADYIDTP